MGVGEGGYTGEIGAIIQASGLFIDFQYDLPFAGHADLRENGNIRQRIFLSGKRSR